MRPHVIASRYNLVAPRHNIEISRGCVPSLGIISHAAPPLPDFALMKVIGHWLKPAPGSQSTLKRTFFIACLSRLPLADAGFSLWHLLPKQFMNVHKRKICPSPHVKRDATHSKSAEQGEAHSGTPQIATPLRCADIGRWMRWGRYAFSIGGGQV